MDRRFPRGSRRWKRSERPDSLLVVSLRWFSSHDLTTAHEQVVSEFFLPPF